MFWNRKSGTGAFYKNGFSFESGIYGSWYTPPQQGTGLTLNGTVILNLSGGNLAADWNKPVTLNSKTLTYSSDRSDAVLTISAGTGTFTGKLVDVNGKARPFKGVLLQRQNQARGCFYGPSQSGEVLLQSF
jgi:hypothetical protein